MAAKNILVTGGGGYIGGAVVADLLSRSSGPVKGATISTTVRSEKEMQTIAQTGANVLCLDLNDEAAVYKAVLDNQIDIVVHAASSMFVNLATNLIKALGQRHRDTGNKVYFIHSSVLNAYDELNGWTYGEVKDTDPIFEKEKSIRGPVQITNVAVIEEAKAQGVTAVVIPVSMIYGRGTGAGRKLSVNIPAFVRKSVEDKVVYKFEVEGHPPSEHISDLTSLYILIVEKFLQGEPIPTGEDGYYFAMVHRIHWWDVMQRLADSLYKRGLVNDPKVQTWPSYEKAAEELGWPAAHIRAMSSSAATVVAVKASQIGWRPTWDEQRFLDSIDDEVQAALDLSTHKSTLFNRVVEEERSKKNGGE